MRCATLRPDGMMTQFTEASLYSTHEDTVCKTLQQDARAVLVTACLFFCDSPRVGRGVTTGSGLSDPILCLVGVSRG